MAEGHRRYLIALREEVPASATLVPRRLVIVEELAPGRLGRNAKAPRVRGRTSSQDKEPWKSLEPLEGPVEIEMLRPVYLGESIGPYRVLSNLTGWQSEGQWGKRDFDKAMFNLPIPLFDPKSRLHKELAAAAMHAEFVSSRVEVKAGEYFVTTRNRIRRTLVEEGIADDIEKLVEKLLGSI